jgi:hypothetical protein
MENQYPQTDNIEMYVRALDCDSPYFTDFKPYGSASKFYDNCAEVEYDILPQIRVSSEWFYFNITNFA